MKHLKVILQNMLLHKSKRLRSYEKNWFIFDPLRCSKNKPGLKIFLVLYGKKMCPVNKRTESGPEIVLY